MPLDDSGQGAAPPPVTLDSIREKYPQYQDMGDEQLARGLHQKFYADMPFDAFAGKIGYRQAPPLDAGLTNADQISQQEPPDGPVKRVVQAVGRGALEGWQNTGKGTILSPEAQEKMDAAQREGGFKGTLAKVGSTAAEDVGFGLGAIPGAFNAAMGAYQGAARQTGVETGFPETGEAAAGIPQAFMEAFPQESMGIRGVLPPRVPAAGAWSTGPKAEPGSPQAIAGDVAKAKADAEATRAARSQQPPAETPMPPGGPITPDQALRAEQEQEQEQGETAPAPPPPVPPSPPPTPPTPEPKPAPVVPPPPEPVPIAPEPTPEQSAPVGPAGTGRIRTVAQIMQEDGVSAKIAAQTQEQEILARARPITEEDRASRAAGVQQLPPKRAEPVPVPPPTGPAPEAAGPTGAYVMLDPDQVKVDPARFQFKASDERGVTGALQGTDKWEPLLANPVLVWQDTDGQLYIGDGHQRHDLATRAKAAGQQDVQMPARILRAADGYTPDSIKVLAAYKNIAEGSGSAIDAAKILRNPSALPDGVTLPTLPPKSALVQQAMALKNLSPEAFGAVENGVIAPEHAAQIGALISDPTEQMAAIDTLVRARPANINQARLMVQDIKNSGFLKGNQTSLFGNEDFARSLVPERAQILDNAMQTLRRTRGLFKAAVEGESDLTAAGNKMSTEANANARTDNERLLDILQRDATTKGPISDALNGAAADLAGGKPRAGVTSAFLARVRQILQRGEAAAVPDGAPDGGTGYEGQVGLEAPKPPKPVGPDLFGDQQAERAPRPPPEPTIKNDPRQQSLLGTEPTAKQAQAASEAAGPRSNQKPADEGLFARPEPEQPSLLPEPERQQQQAPPVSRFMGWGTRAGIQDLLHTVPDRMGGHAEAARWVGEMGAKTGHEHIAVVDNKTGEIVHASTDGLEESVSYGVGDLHMGAADADAYTVHHNHPTGGSLSGGDIAQLAANGVSHIVAVGSDGHSFTASSSQLKARPLGNAGVLSRVMTAITGQFDRLADKVVRMASDAYFKGDITKDEYNLAVSDVTNRILHAMGVIDYTTTRPMFPGLWAGTAQLLQDMRINGFDRPSPDVRPDQGLGKLRPPVQRDAAAGVQASSGAGEGNAAGEPAPVGGRESPPSGRGPKPVQGRLLDQSLPPLESPEPAGPDLFGREPTEPEEDKSKQQKLGIPPAGPTDILRDRTGMARAVAEIKATFAPASMKGAQPMEAAWAKSRAEFAQSQGQTGETLEAVRNALDKLPIADQDAFTHRVETGQGQLTPELQRAADAIRGQYQVWLKKVQGLGKGYLETPVENYMGRVYSNYNEWANNQPGLGKTPQERLDASIAASRGKSLTGSGAFLKQRTFMSLRDAMAAGLEPVTHNPIDMAFLKLTEMQKMYHGTMLADEMKRTGMARWITAGQEGAARRAGYVQLDDKTFRPRLMGDANPAGFGRLEPGNYWAVEPVARLFNRYTSGGLAGKSSIYDGIRLTGSALNSLQLGASGFHATFVAFDSMISQVGLGIQQIAGGNLSRGVGNVLGGVLPLYPTVKAYQAGKQLRAAWLDPDGATPEWRALAQRLNEGGGRAGMDRFMGASTSGTFIKKLSDFADPALITGRLSQMFADEPSAVKRALVVPLKVAGRLIDTSMAPLMEHLVPKVKLGVFANMARAWEEANPGATPEARSAAMVKAWDSVENRLGQLTYDNIGWHKVAKDIAFISTRSVGWNLGTLREIGGSAPDAARWMAGGMKSADFTSRMAYVLAMPLVTATYGALATWLMTGQPPSTMADYFYPPTGGSAPSGEPERLSIPGYAKDVYAFSHSPWQTVLNKTAPLIETGKELINNQDYYGGIIYDPNRDNVAAAYGNYLLNQALPFSFRGQQRMSAEGANGWQQAAAFWGFQPAPKSVTAPERGLAWQTRENTKEYRTRARESGRITFFGASP